MRAFYICLLLGMVYLAGCNDTKIGYLKTDNASYGIDSLVVRKQLDPNDPDDQKKIEMEIPWLTEKIQGVLGTAPLRYELLSVSGPSAEGESVFAEEINVRGSGMMELPLHTELPVGRYIVSLRVHNEDYSAELKDIYTFIVREK